MSRFMLKSALCLLLIAWCAPAFSAVITVNSGGGADWDTITSAVQAAALGDEVRIVGGGPYNENVAFDGLQLTSVPAGAVISGSVQTQGTNAALVEGVVFAGNPSRGMIVQTTVAGTTVRNCQFRNSPFGIQVDFGPENVVLDVESCLFEFLTNQGAIAMYRSTALSLIDTTIRSCSQWGILRDGSQTADPTVISLTGSTITGNGNDGVCSFRRMTSLVLDSTEVSENRFGVYLDGEANLSGGSSMVGTSSQIINNRAHGIFFARTSTLTLTDSTVSGNGDYGIILDDYTGGPFNSVIALIDGCTLSSNAQKGLGVFLKGGTGHSVTLTDSTISGNGERQIHIEGAGIGQTVAIAVRRNMFADNDSSAHFNVVATDTEAGSQIVNNVIDGGSLGIHVAQTSNVDIAFNTIVNCDNGIEIASPTSATINIVNNIVDGGTDGVSAPDGTTGIGNVSIDYNLLNSTNATDADMAAALGTNNIVGQSPNFVGPSATAGAGNYRLGDPSPALGTALEVGVTDDVMMAARPRPAGTDPDMGAYESYLVPTELSDFTLE